MMAWDICLKYFAGSELSIISKVDTPYLCLQRDHVVYDEISAGGSVLTAGDRVCAEGALVVITTPQTPDWQSVAVIRQVEARKIRDGILGHRQLLVDSFGRRKRIAVLKIKVGYLVQRRVVPAGVDQFTQSYLSLMDHYPINVFDQRTGRGELFDLRRDLRTTQHDVAIWVDLFG